MTVEKKIEATELRENSTYVLVTMFMAIIFLNFIPLSVLIFINMSLYRAVKARTKRVVKMTTRKVMCDLRNLI